MNLPGGAVGRWVLVHIVICAAAGVARADPSAMAFEFWKEPDADALRATVSDVRRLVDALEGRATAEVVDDGLGIQVAVAGKWMFRFPGEGPSGPIPMRSPLERELGPACALVMREHFTPDELSLYLSPGSTPDVRAGAALFRRILGREPPALRPVTPGDDGDDYAMGMGMGFGFGAWVYPLLALGFIFLMWRGGAGWLSYYAFWLVGPTLLFALAAQPFVLLVIPVALTLRRVLPDPFLYLKNARRIRSLGVDVRSNAENAAARRSLAMLWLEMRRPARAVPLVEEALRRLPDDTELFFLYGQALLGVRRWDAGLEAFLRVLDREPRLRYGEAYLRGADALIALARWEEAEEGLAHFATVNRSSIEGRFKLARVRRARGDGAGAKAALADVKAVYRDSPAFHRRKQLAWYLRAVVAAWFW